MWALRVQEDGRWVLAGERNVEEENEESALT
jgi:hypothetical protein